MYLKTLTITALSATFLFGLPMHEVKAGSTGKVLGGIAAGAAAGYIAHKVIKNRNEKRRARREYREYNDSPSTAYSSGPVYSQATFDTQTRLNVLGYDAGEPDGIAGRKTRQAIRQFQIVNDQPVTGTLTNPQIALLHQQSTNVLAGHAPNATNEVAAAEPQDLAPQYAAQSDAVVSDGAPSNPTALSPALGVAPYSTAVDRPTVLGITVGDSLINAHSALKQDGFENCDSYDNAIFCERYTSFGSDKIAVAASDKKIHTITRKLSFNTPIEPAKVYGRMPASYSHLLNSPNKTIASSAACDALVSAKPDTFDSVVEQSINGAPFDASTVGFSHACSYYFAIDIANTPTVGEAELTFFDAEPILAHVNGNTVRHVGTTTTGQSGPEERLKF